MTKKHKKYSGPNKARESKAYYWNCKCGCINFAPAKQTPDTVVACVKCDREFKWRDVSMPELMK